MSATTQKIFLQIGATRDGLDPYLDASKRRGLKAILVETPDYIQLRHKLGRRPFDVEFAVAQAYDPNQVFKTLGDIKDNVRLTLPGFERYCECAYSLAEILRVPPWRETIHPHFSPPDKWNQRRLLSEKASGVLQPAYDMMHCTSDLTEDFLNNLKYPVVVKPVNSGGGLAVFLVEDYSQLQAALAQIRQLTNYEGTSFEKVIFEEYIQGTEYSVQGIS